MALFHKILVGYDGSEGARRALRLATSLARDQQAELWAVAVEEELPRYAATIDEVEEDREAIDRYFQRLFDEAVREAATQDVRLQTATKAGHGAQAIVAYAKDGNFDLLVIGHSGHSEIWGRFMGSTADKITRHAPCSVLVVR